MTSLEIGRVVDPGAIEIAAGVGRVPEPAHRRIEGPIRRDVQVAALRRRLADMELRHDVLARTAIAVEEDEEGRGLGRVVVRRNMDGHRSIAADDDCRCRWSGDATGALGAVEGETVGAALVAVGAVVAGAGSWLTVALFEHAPSKTADSPSSTRSR